MKTSAKKVPVYTARGEMVGLVSQQCTSVGAAKLGRFDSAQWSGRFGVHGWVEVTERDRAEAAESRRWLASGALKTTGFGG